MRDGNATKNQFGTFGGVYTPCILTIIGVVMFLRGNFVIGEAGVLGSLLIIAMGSAITGLTALSTSAIVTNMEMRGGGAYYIISRVLGFEFGGAIGLTLFLAQGASVSFHILGFSEALVIGAPALQPWYAWITLGTAVVIFAITYIGADWSIKVQFFILAALGLSIFGFMAGAAWRFDAALFEANLWAAPPGFPGHHYSFWQVFAIYFPAVTGFLVGINMSGDLKDPARSIPKGVFLAIGTGFAVYCLQAVLFGGAFPRAALIGNPYGTIRQVMHPAFGWLVTLGMFAAAISSALGTHMSAPRVLQALARDNILPFLSPLGKGAAKGDEPRRAVALVGVMTFTVLAWAVTVPMEKAFNTVAQTITLFFIATYAMLNIAAFIEAYGENPSFRPRFRYFHYTTAFLGAAGCVAVAFIISTPKTLVIAAVLAVMMRQIQRRQMRAAHGDARRGFLYRSVRANLLRLEQTEETPKNWRPTCLVFSGEPESRYELVSYGVWFEAGRGLVYLVQVLRGRLEEMLAARREATERLREFCREKGIQAFPAATVAPSLEEGIIGIFQNLTVGPVRPNMALFGWSKKGGKAGSLSPRLFRLAHQLGMAICVLRAGTGGATAGRRRVDVWWRGMKNGSLLLLLAHLLRENWEWRQTPARLLRVVADESERESTLRELEEMLHRARLNITPVVIVSAQSFRETLHRESSDATLVLMGFELPEEERQDTWFDRYGALMPPGPDVVLVSSPGNEDIFS